MRLQKLTPYIRLCEGEGPPVYLQDGQVWSEGGTDALPPDDLPRWFPEALARLTVAARQSVGFRLESDPALPVAPEPEPLRPPKRRGPRLGRPRTEG